MSNIDEQLSAYTRRRIPYNEISRIIDGVIDYDITPAWYDDKDEWISEVCNYIVDYINEDDYINLTPKDKDDLYYYVVDTYGEYLSGYYDQWKKGMFSDLSEQSNRIKSMMGIIREAKSKKEFLFSYLDKNGFTSIDLKKILAIEDNDWSQHVKEYLGDDYEKVIVDDVRELVENFTECDGDVFGLELVSIFFGGGTWQDTSYSINIRINPESPVFETIDLNDYEDVLTLFGQIEACVENYLNDIIYDKYGAVNHHTMVQVG
jgi:hypothetical protein